jgi:iron complex outermembrane receptor protein
MNSNGLKLALAGGVSAIAIATSAYAAQFDIPSGELRTALNSYAQQSGIQLVVSGAAIKGIHTRGVKGELPVEVALAKILAGTGMAAKREQSAVAIVPANAADAPRAQKRTELAAATPVYASAGVETVVVTSSKIKGDIQTVPIAITALSQEQLTSRQIAGGPDLVKEVPNLTFSKTNFTGYNIQIRGIGTQAISVTTDPAVAVALNDIPFLRNHFFEQEFYDVGQVEVVRGPQGTLYGRNATAGVVNVISAKPTDHFEAMLSADWGNFSNRRYEGMVNIPLVDDRLDLRVAGEWTKRDGYTYNETTGKQIDGRDLWSSRVTVGWKPYAGVEADLVWEHFSENDDRLRSGKQLCKRDPGPDSVGPVNQEIDRDGHFAPGDYVSTDISGNAALSQGCLPVSLYSPESRETPNGQALPLVYAAEFGSGFFSLMPDVDPYLSTAQPNSLRVIQSELTPKYKANNDTIELNVTYNVTPSLTFSSNSGYNHDSLVSFEDFNRYNSRPGIFFSSPTQTGGNPTGNPTGVFGVRFTPGGVLCDPQLGCSNEFVGEDLSQEHAWQISQEFRLASNFKGPLNFSIGANYMHYETLEDFYVFLNVLTLESRFIDAASPPTANESCLFEPAKHVYTVFGQTTPLFGCPYTDATPLTPGFDGEGHNYFRSENPYRLNSYAGFGEVYYQVLDDLKLTGGLRWTSDQKHFTEIPSETLISAWGYPVTGNVDQEWNEWTGRAVADWAPKLDFTDQTLVYGSFSRGYKAGGANPPGPNVFQSSEAQEANHPLTFKPEFVNAYELGTKNTLFDGAMTFDADIFHYDYKGYQISEIVDRTSINLNFDATINGAELESSWEPLPGLKFNFAGGYENTSVAKGSKAIDLMDRTAGQPGWMVVKPSVFSTSNCILPTYLVADLLAGVDGSAYYISSIQGAACEDEYTKGIDALQQAYFLNSGFDPSTAPNGGAGFDKDLSGNKLPNAPKFTTSLSAEYTMPISEDWAATLHSDFYWQSQSFARIFNDRPYDKLRGYSNVNAALILTSASGWQVMGYVKNIFDTTAITGAFLYSDDVDLTTNIFTTDPRLYGVRITKNW